ncbi:pyridoxal phosphate-dependent aminotransferase [Stappia taiwanensis]|uniref:aspartate transaminase n=1 Tax=Stappia taiwanensis TaxID=992267 RepID=A0A838Y3M3_9HYPH|nr:pyridoxal phosphate-dependent aminotransferase [Stappia taiwanensis]MBA4613774.1 pyridoxal phosphate-dependent aminotransferase [Stappia taiwanensis]GGE93476.1 aminotransferase [Stappia taiwanensis]
MTDCVAALRPQARMAPESGIVEVVNFARERDDLIPLWVGEGDLPTPEFIREAAAASLARGETFYTYQRGIPALRSALARYHLTHYGCDWGAERYFITGSGMQAIQLAVQAVAGEGDEVVYPSPAWPNFPAAVEVMGARAVPVRLEFSQNGWSLDPERLFAAVTDRTRALYLNSPGNPNGWVADRQTLQTILDEARRRGLWIITDEVYNRIMLDGSARAPSFYDVAEPDDLILYVNTFSKNWAMTGWRVGWLSAPPAMGQVVENLIQYSTSGVAEFMQHGALAAVEQGEAFLQSQLERSRQGLEIVTEALSASDRVRFAQPAGGFYLFFGVDGEPDCRDLALRLVSETGVGLAPGRAFGTGGEGFLRLCFARSADDLRRAGERLGDWLSR